MTLILFCFLPESLLQIPYLLCLKSYEERFLFGIISYLGYLLLPIRHGLDFVQKELYLIGSVPPESHTIDFATESE